MTASLIFCFLSVIFCFDRYVSASFTEQRYKGRYTRSAVDYDLVIPRRVNEYGEFISHQIPRHYKRSFYRSNRNIDEEADKIHYMVAIDGEDHHIELWPNTELISPGMVIEKRTKRAKDVDDKGGGVTSDDFDDLSPSVNMRKADDTQCHFQGRVRGDQTSRVALSTCYGLAGHIRTKRGYYIIEPAEGHDPLEGNEHPHLVYNLHANDDHSHECGVKENLATVLTRRTLKQHKLNMEKRETFDNKHTVNINRQTRSDLVFNKRNRVKKNTNSLTKRKEKRKDNKKRVICKKQSNQQSPNSHASFYYLSYPTDQENINQQILFNQQDILPQPVSTIPIYVKQTYTQYDTTPSNNMPFDDLQLNPYLDTSTETYQLMNDLINPDTLTFFQLNANPVRTNSQPSFPVDSFPIFEDSQAGNKLAFDSKKIKQLLSHGVLLNTQGKSNNYRSRRQDMNSDLSNEFNSQQSMFNLEQEINSPKYDNEQNKNQFDISQTKQNKFDSQKEYAEDKNLLQPEIQQKEFLRQTDYLQPDIQQNDFKSIDSLQNNIQQPYFSDKNVQQSYLPNNFQQTDVNQNYLEQNIPNTNFQQDPILNNFQLPDVQQNKPYLQHNTFQPFIPQQTDIQQNVQQPNILQSDLPQFDIPHPIFPQHNLQQLESIQANSLISNSEQSSLHHSNSEKYDIKSLNSQKTQVRQTGEQSTKQSEPQQTTPVSQLSSEATTESHCNKSDKECDIKKKPESTNNITTTTPKQTKKSKSVTYRKGDYINIETLVVVDKTMLDYHIEVNIEDYVFTVFNMAYDLFSDETFGIPTNLVLVRLIKLIQEDDDMNLSITKNATKTLDSFLNWQYNINDANDSHPNHHDVAVLLTRIDICGEQDSCGLFGLAKLASACDLKMQGVISQDIGLKVGYVIAHEIGHTLGIPHDTEEESGCPEKFYDDSTPVMSPKLSMKTYEWSHCSKKYFNMFLKSGFGDCLLDEPTDHNFDVLDVLPGVMYGYEYQCKHLLIESAKPCDLEVVCDSLNCYLEQYGCIETNIPPAPGTACGEKKWCYRGECVPVGMRYGVNKTDGGWGKWNSWSKCSRTCGMGVAWSERNCDNPRPAYGGEPCKGPHKRHKVCNLNPCNVTALPFRDVQCASYNQWLFPEDQSTHKWKSIYLPDENPCTLFCVNENGTIISPKPEVIDGTQCYSSLRDICVGGLCKEVPCDYDLESNAVEDACGICKGDGTECDYQTGLRYSNPHTNCSLLEIPVGARNVRVEVMKPSKTKMIIKDKSGLRVYNDGENLGIFDVPGSKALLGMIRNQQTTLDIPGPVSEELSVWIQVCENDLPVSFAMAVKTSRRRRASFEWDFIDWTPCNAACGPGSSESLPKCVEREAGHVDDSYCESFPKPELKIRSCENTPCDPRWLVSNWKECIDGKRSRSVKCVRPSGHSESEIDILPEENCKITKPIESQPCNDANVSNSSLNDTSSNTTSSNKTCGCNANTTKAASPSNVKSRSVNRQDDDSDIEYEKVLKKLQKHERAKNFELKFLSSKIRARKRSQNNILDKRDARKPCQNENNNTSGKGTLYKDVECIDSLKVVVTKNVSQPNKCCTENQVPTNNGSNIMSGKKRMNSWKILKNQETRRKKFKRLMAQIYLYIIVIKFIYF